VELMDDVYRPIYSVGNDGTSRLDSRVCGDIYMGF